jgi:hypothetical protein
MLLHCSHFQLPSGIFGSVSERLNVKLITTNGKNIKQTIPEVICITSNETILLLEKHPVFLLKETIAIQRSVKVTNKKAKIY